MKQDMSTATEKTEQPAEKLKKSKPAKNLYEPYSTPRVLYELMRGFCRLVFLLTMRVHLRGRYNVPRKGPFIIASNHLSWMDVPLVPAYLPGKVIYMAKEEVFLSKVGWLARFLGAFPVKRGEGDRHAIRAADEQLKQKKVLVIFPEGTRSKSHTLGKGHAGLGLIALRADVPIVPVAIWGSENALKKFGAQITISYGEPMTFKLKGSKVTKEDISAANEAVMQRIASMLPARYRGIYGDDALPSTDEAPQMTTEATQA
jgi:1-acyl-sn-glycerol-3-phosphate acyltransferase